MNAINVDSVSLKIGYSNILDDISFSVQNGNIHALIGNNGAGKTSLLRILLGLTPKYDGNIKFFGSADIIHQRKYIGSVIDSIHPDRNKTVYSYLRSVCCMFGTANEKFENTLLSKVGLESARNKIISKCSLGMERRLMIACALASKPKILILDEPFNGIDPNGMNEMRLLLQQLNAENVTVLITSHIIPELLKVANIFTVLNNGRIVETISSNGLSEKLYYKTLVRPKNGASFVKKLKLVKPNVLCQSDLNGIVAIYGECDFNADSLDESYRIVERIIMTEEDILLWKMNGNQ